MSWVANADDKASKIKAGKADYAIEQLPKDDAQVAVDERTAALHGIGEAPAGRQQPSTLDVRSQKQFEQGKAAAKALVESGTLGEDSHAHVTLSGHANDPEDAADIVSDHITVSVVMVREQ